jgi:cytosine/adenosine deaminase-related metal-dependent hydrolase
MADPASPSSRSTGCARQAATINPARYFGREKVQGTIEADKRADLVLLDSDPLLDIRVWTPSGSQEPHNHAGGTLTQQFQLSEASSSARARGVLNTAPLT